MELKRILIVDDEPNVTLILSRSLDKLDKKYEVETAQSGEEALSKIENKPYALVITDYKMPEMNGLDLAMAVRRIAPETQVILMTAHGTRSLQNTADGLDLDGYIDKPFKLSEIREIVEAAVSSTEVADPYRSGEQGVEDAVLAHLVSLQEDTGARCVMLLSSGGYPIEIAGMTKGLDTSTVGALVAANFMAAIELSKMLGNTSIFKSSYHEGPDYNIYAYDVNGDLLLAVIFGTEAKTGAVWHFTKHTALELAELDLNQAPEALPGDEDMLESLDDEFDLAFGQLTRTDHPEGWETSPHTEIHRPNHELSSMFAQDSDGGPGQHRGSTKLMDLREAVAAGLVPSDILDAANELKPS
jgi:two-component system, response regulator, stage 0 sporulation protein F